ncbi:mitochondrial inner membrane protease subunit 2-like [Triticum dicoccoides]|uniref:mitochondrial inner membrane protease subunit 2-like n=1 Tax=Triticum dicoccoides TaxID=85692 RepID=UPI0018918F30|nr:mitochondrial inner membrane protease subunit 2-like [Triticum dicoccoides]
MNFLIGLAWAVVDTSETSFVPVCRSPVDHRRKTVERLIGLPGDWVGLPEKEEVRKIPEGHCWVEGGNGSVSRDSRAYGPVPLGLVQGRVTHVVWPPSKMGRVHKRVPSEGRVMPQRNL